MISSYQVYTNAEVDRVRSRVGWHLLESSCKYLQDTTLPPLHPQDRRNLEYIFKGYNS